MALTPKWMNDVSGICQYYYMISVPIFGGIAFNFQEHLELFFKMFAAWLSLTSLYSWPVKFSC